jgi:tetratricopeptide (TPR) repeat protein
MPPKPLPILGLCLFYILTGVNAIAQIKTHQNLELDSLTKLVDNHKTKDTVRVHLLISLARHYISGDIGKNPPLLKEALQISEELQYKRGIGLALNALSQHATVKGEYDQGLQYALRAKETLKEIQDDGNLLITNSNLARIYNVTGKYEKALEIHLQNIELVKNNAPSSEKAGLFFYVAKTYEQLNDYKKAEEYYVHAKRISEEANFSTGIAIAEGSLGNLHNNLKNYPLAIQYLNKTLAYAEQHNQVSNVAATHFALAKSYEGLQDYKRAISNNQKSIQIYEGLGNLRLLKDAYLNHYKYYEQLSEWNKANEYLKLHYAMVDSIFSENKVKIIEELQTKYETEKKDLEIANLAQQASIKDLEIKQKNQALIIGLFVVLFIAGFIYLLYRQRALKNIQKQTALEQRFLRSQLNPHFISNALMAIQNFMLKNQAEKAATYLAKFAKLMREILENSRKEFILVEDEIQMLTNYLDIHRVRMNDSFDYAIEVNENIDRETDAIPPMFVQPFIENAIEHGIINAKTQGMIKLKLVKVGDYISIEISDNGGGMVEQKQELKEHTSLSTTIIQERMALLNKTLKKKIELVWENILNENGEVNGTKVELKVPYSYL